MIQADYLRLMRESSPEDCGCGPKNPCGGLECLCRPRFFAGQLLSDDDLNALDRYIVAKDRLHNRHLHGTGVVCGLEVVCNPCDDTVTVRTGYALGPCGEDIVVCHDVSVDVGDLIREVRQKKAKEDDCRPYGRTPDGDCEAAEQEWVLSICYHESPSRGVTSLRPPAKESCGCGCGGGGGGKSSGCGCGGGSSRNHSSNGVSCGCTTKPRRPAQCEPTLTCEGFTFKLTKPERKPNTDGRTNEGFSQSELGKRVFACLASLLSRMQGFPQDPSPAVLSEFCCSFKGDLREIIETGNVHDCRLGARLSEIVCPDANDPEFSGKISQSLVALLQIAIDLFKSCVCSALLPPCPGGSPDDCVPLATVRVRTADLRVLSICNWSARKFVVGFPTLGYWLGWIPIFDTLRDTIVRLCCSRAATRFDLGDNFRVVEKANSGFTPTGVTAARSTAEGVAASTSEINMSRSRRSAVSDLTAKYAAKTTSLSGVEATMLGGLGMMDSEGKPLASELELMNPFAAMALTRFAGPSADSVVPTELSSVLGQLFGRGKDTGLDDTAGRGGGKKKAAPSDADRMAKLETAVAELTKTVKAQKTTIDKMRRSPKRG